MRIDSVGERQVIHELIRENGGRWTWAGEVNIEGTRNGDDERRPVFVSFEDANHLSLKPTAEKHSYVCETTYRPQ